MAREHTRWAPLLLVPASSAAGVSESEISFSFGSWDPNETAGPALLLADDACLQQERRGPAGAGAAAVASGCAAGAPGASGGGGAGVSGVAAGGGGAAVLEPQPIDPPTARAVTPGAAKESGSQRNNRG
eukprot:696611-Prymnesium_polylepis.1